MDGIYETSINTPMGPINARLTLKTNGNDLNGILEVMGMKNNITGGNVKGNVCYLNGSIQNNMINITYNIQGELKGNVLIIHAKTNMGEFKLQAKKVA